MNYKLVTILETYMLIPKDTFKQTHRMITINETGAFIFLCLEANVSKSDLIEAYKKKFGLSESQALEDIASCLDTFKQKDIYDASLLI